LVLAELLVLSLGLFGPSLESAQAYGGRTPGAVVAFYYPWYDARDPNSFWDASKMSSLPKTRYQSGDFNYVRSQMTQARNAGIDSFAVSWNGPTGDWATRFSKMLEMADNGFTLAVHYETTLVSNNSLENTVANLRYIKDNYARNPSYLRYEGKPVIFFWRAELVTPIPNWQTIRKQVDPNAEMYWSVDGVDINLLQSFDAIHLFSAAKYSNDPTGSYKQFRSQVNDYQTKSGQRKLWIAGVTPGYDDRKLRQPGEFRDRESGSYYQRSWQAAINSNPDLITISTWNEWYEGSSIEEGEAWGNQYLAATSQFTNQYKGTTKLFGEASILKVWGRTDLPVAAGAVSRSWLWGPEKFAVEREKYKEGPDGFRLVYYFDKSRMEITRPTSDANSQYFVTNGLLVRELMRGKIAVGDDPNAEENKGPAAIPVAGDLNNNAVAPTFASMAGVALLTDDKKAANRTGQLITDTLAGNGQTGQNGDFGRFNIKYAQFEPTLSHNIAQPFWDFFQQTGPIREDGVTSNGKVVDYLFAMGYPITEAFWCKVKVAGEEKEVLVQAFERRIMTYTPSNSAAFQVEMGNVGLQYYRWRYGK